jgi:hypothetical protein
MEYSTLLREQAVVLRTMADILDIATIRAEAVALAEKCEALAKALEENPPDESGAPITSSC